MPRTKDVQLYKAAAEVYGDVQQNMSRVKQPGSPSVEGAAAAATTRTHARAARRCATWCRAAAASEVLLVGPAVKHIDQSPRAHRGAAGMRLQREVRQLSPQSPALSASRAMRAL